MKKLMAVIGIILSVCIPATAVQAKEPLSAGEVYEIAEDVAEQYNICPEFLQAIAFRESSYDPYAQNGDCTGIMQVSLRWHKDRMERLGITDLYDPKDNMLVAADYLYELFEEYEDVGMVLLKYNGDSRADDYYNGRVGLSEYANDILELSAELERKNGK